MNTNSNNSGLLRSKKRYKKTNIYLESKNISIFEAKIRFNLLVIQNDSFSPQRLGIIWIQKTRQQTQQIYLQMRRRSWLQFRRNYQIDWLARVWLSSGSRMNFPVCGKTGDKNFNALSNFRNRPEAWWRRLFGGDEELRLYLSHQGSGQIFSSRIESQISYYCNCDWPAWAIGTARNWLV